MFDHCLKHIVLNSFLWVVELLPEGTLAKRTYLWMGQHLMNTFIRFGSCLGAKKQNAKENGRQYGKAEKVRRIIWDSWSQEGSWINLCLLKELVPPALLERTVLCTMCFNLIGYRYWMTNEHFLHIKPVRFSVLEILHFNTESPMQVKVELLSKKSVCWENQGMKQTS